MLSRSLKFACTNFPLNTFRDRKICWAVESCFAMQFFKRKELNFTQTQLPAVNSFVIPRCATNISFLAQPKSRRRKKRFFALNAINYEQRFVCADRSYVLCFWFGGILAQRIPSDVIYIELSFVLHRNEQSTIKHFAKR